MARVTNEYKDNLHTAINAPCLYCGIDNSSLTCHCPKTQKPTTGKAKKVFYSRKVSADTRPLQIDPLKDANQKFKYQSDFSSSFNIHLCSRCHNIYQRRGKQERQDSVQQPAQMYLLNLSLKIRLQLIRRTLRKSMPCWW